MNNNIVAKLRSARSAIADNTSPNENIQHILSCRPLSYRRPQPTTPLLTQAHILESSTDDQHNNELLAHSILVNNAARRRGFLPYYYRTANTFEAIRRQRVHLKPTPKPSPTFLPLFKRSGTRSVMADHLTNVATELTELNLIRHEKSMVNHVSFSAMDVRHGKGALDVEFSTEIPNTLELVVQTSARKSIMERSLLETLKRQRSEHTRYRTLPVNRAPYV